MSPIHNDTKFIMGYLNVMSAAPSLFPSVKQGLCYWAVNIYSCPLLNLPEREVRVKAYPHFTVNKVGRSKNSSTLFATLQWPCSQGISNTTSAQVLSWAQQQKQLPSTFRDLQPGLRELHPGWHYPTCGQHGPCSALLNFSWL